MTAVKVCPTAEELSEVDKVPCPECECLFNSDSNLNLHLSKTHKKLDLLKSSSEEKIYHCPIEGCIYNEASHFKSYKFLKQHYLKVHLEKKFICNSCRKGFPTKVFLNRHVEFCNVKFKCCDCQSSYDCYETLKTHCRRKKHSILQKSEYKACGDVLKDNRSETIILSSRTRLILPKMTKSDQSCQTDYSKMKQNSQETQTGAMHLPYLTVETQTIGDYYPVKKSDSDSRSAKTQTLTKDPKTVSCNTFENIEDIELEASGNKNSSSTQTCDYTTIHTDTSDLFLDSNFFNCNSETQTDSIFNDELFKCCDYSSNMYTQTCEDLFLGEIAINNIHTQTVLDDMLKSVESQTVMSQYRQLPLSCKDMGHMETQTDVEFKQMLEEINA